jgi:hypothetical protein
MVMGKAEDIRAGAIVHVTGKIAQDRSVQAKQMVILQPRGTNCNCDVRHGDSVALRTAPQPLEPWVRFGTGAREALSVPFVAAFLAGISDSGALHGSCRDRHDGVVTGQSRWHSGSFGCVSSTAV